ncbi:FmdB family zinc ribbon protein [Hydrogenispora ethanolica]|uniref:FmdB family zinc ribbon protein n=1 Tax=Hydrogenispora ethanolica TaxID=1082276 RepID=UPI001FB30C25|nr:zinc ribbon domain-containing protein [Hydrogenispora ethanolica]
MEVPIYEFRCSDCQRDFEELCRLDQPVKVCPFCGSRQIRKKMSAFAGANHGTSGGSSSSHSCGSCHGGHCGSCH